jgi:hypothetical protein
MSETSETSFADALLNAERSVPPGVSAHNAANPSRRFAVYRNNVMAGLCGGLKRRYRTAGRRRFFRRDGAGIREAESAALAAARALWR